MGFVPNFKQSNMGLVHHVKRSGKRPWRISHRYRVHWRSTLACQDKTKRAHDKTLVCNNLGWEWVVDTQNNVKISGFKRNDNNILLENVKINKLMSAWSPKWLKSLVYWYTCCVKNLNFLFQCHALPSPAIFLNLPKPLHSWHMHARTHTHTRTYTHSTVVHSRCVEAFGSSGFTLKIRQDINHQTRQSYILVQGLQTVQHTDEGEHFQHVKMN